MSELDKKGAIQALAVEVQYDYIGDNYDQGKRGFFNENTDPGKIFILRSLGNVAGKDAIDVGTGAGEELGIYRSLGFRSIIGIDPSRVMVEKANKLLGDANAARIGSWTAIPSLDNSVDFLIGRFSLHYVANLDDAYIEASRVLRPNGEMLLVLPHPQADTTVVEQDGQKLVETKLFEGKVTVYYPPHRLSDYFSDKFRGLFDIVEREDYESPERERIGKSDSFIIRARKK